MHINVNFLHIQVDVFLFQLFVIKPFIFFLFFLLIVCILQLLLAVGTKLEHVIIQLAHEVAEKHSAIQGELVVQPSDDHFWFHRPRIVLFLIHLILFQNSFEIAFFFWILVNILASNSIYDILWYALFSSFFFSFSLLF